VTNKYERERGLSSEDYADTLFTVYDAGGGLIGIRLHVVADIKIPRNDEVAENLQFENVAMLMYERLLVDINECGPHVQAKVERAMHGDFTDEPSKG